jgi:hypothetical protein
MSRMLLGLYDQPVGQEDVTSYDVNKIGGDPVSIHVHCCTFSLHFNWEIEHGSVVDNLV